MKKRTDYLKLIIKIKTLNMIIFKIIMFNKNKIIIIKLNEID